MASNVPAFMLNSSPGPSSHRGGGRVSTTYLESGIKDFASLFTEGHNQWEVSLQKGFLNNLDARMKIAFWISLIIVISLKHSVLSEAGIFIFLFLLVVLGRLNLGRFYSKVLLLGFGFGFLVSAPSALNIIVPGKTLIPLITFAQPYKFWVYKVPQVIGITEEGMRIVSLLTLRVFNSLSVSFLILYTTPFADIVKALKVLRVPDTFLLIISMTYKYILTFAHVVSDMYLARKARLAGASAKKEAGEWIAGRIAFVFKKTQLECEEVFKAMSARGFSGRMRFYYSRKLTSKDWAAGLCLLAAAMGFLFI